jgi:hypothetical protein
VALVVVRGVVVAIASIPAFVSLTQSLDFAALDNFVQFTAIQPNAAAFGARINLYPSSVVD